MRVVVIGAGICGLVTARFLRQQGHEVVVVEALDGPALGASYANGAQLSYSYVAPLAGPGVIPKIPPWLLRRDSPLRFRPSADPAQWAWLARFLLACNRTSSERTTRHLLRLAAESRALLLEFLRSNAGRGIAFGHRTSGKLVAYSDHPSFAAARRVADFQRALGCEQHVVSPDECEAIEPMLSPARGGLGRRIVGGVFTPSEEVGDCHAFCMGLERVLRRDQVEFVYGFRGDQLRRDRGRVTSVSAGPRAIDGDAFVLASGVGSVRLARTVGVALPIAGLKGYSLTLPSAGSAPAVSVTDYARRVVYARIGDEPSAMLRVAGLADLVGNDASIDASRIAVLAAEVRHAFPWLAPADVSSLRPWAGLRPATPDGAPIYGRTGVPNLYVNTGHGALGWTLAHATARTVAQMVDGAGATRKTSLSAA